MIEINSWAEFERKASSEAKSLLLLYKQGNDQSSCAYSKLDEAAKENNEIKVYSADVTKVRDIHIRFGISSVPSLLVFNKGDFENNIKGCNDSSYYKAIMENAVYYAKSAAAGKEVKRVTVYSTPSCSWCNTLKSWLQKNGIRYTDIDVSRDIRAAEELVRRTGQQGVPQTDINGQMVTGFNQAMLKELLEI